MLHAACCARVASRTLHLARCPAHVASRTSHAARRMPHVACRTSHAARCMSYVACREVRSAISFSQLAIATPALLALPRTRSEAPNFHTALLDLGTGVTAQRCETGITKSLPGREANSQCPAASADLVHESKWSCSPCSRPGLRSLMRGSALTCTGANKTNQAPVRGARARIRQYGPWRLAAEGNRKGARRQRGRVPRKITARQTSSRGVAPSL
jgi:hypothetical protein